MSCKVITCYTRHGCTFRAGHLCVSHKSWSLSQSLPRENESTQCHQAVTEAILGGTLLICTNIFKESHLFDLSTTHHSKWHKGAFHESLLQANYWPTIPSFVLHISFISRFIFCWGTRISRLLIMEHKQLVYWRWWKKRFPHSRATCMETRGGHSVLTTSKILRRKRKRQSFLDAHKRGRSRADCWPLGWRDTQVNIGSCYTWAF